MGIIQGVQYNIKGVVLSFKTPKLLLLGVLRFVVVLLLSILLSGLVIYWNETLLNLLWAAPESGWLLYVWKILSWLLLVILMALSMVMGYLIAQVVFCVFIMDYMSRITEVIVLGKKAEFEPESWFSFFLYLIRQEIPRAILPVLISMMIIAAGFLTPFGPFIMVLSSLVAAVFLAWDNTDLTPARRMQPFKERFDFLKRNIGFHVGFGLLFLVPWLNIVFLSFAPVGATLFVLDKMDKMPRKPCV